MEIQLDLDHISTLVAWGQFVSIVLGITLGIYLDDCREIGRQPKGINSKSRPFDWVLNFDVVIPSICAVIFLICGARTLQRVDALKEKLKRAQIGAVIEDIVLPHLSPPQLPEKDKK